MTCYNQMKSARFPMHRDMASFDVGGITGGQGAGSQAGRRSLTEDAQNVVLITRPSTGKTHLATALDISGLTSHSKRVRFYSTVDLVNAPEQKNAH